MGTFIKALLTIALVFSVSGCFPAGNIETQSVSSAPPELESASTGELKSAETIFVEGCKGLSSGALKHKYLETYRPIVEDICADFDMNYGLVEIIQSPKVDPQNVDFYVASNVFGLSYWNRYATQGLVPVKMVLLMEEERDWWSDQLSELLAIEPEWFGPSAEAGHCYAAEAEAFCPKLYVGNEGSTTGEFNVLSTMLGSRMDWSTFRKVVPIHESTHQFQTAEGLGHWRYWFVEGQATYFELAASVLVSELGASNWRDEFSRDSLHRGEDVYDAKTVKEVIAFMRECDSGANCEGFQYFGGSLAHELLVNTFGIDVYMNWNQDLAIELPDFVWEKMPQDKMRVGREGFERLFEKHFGSSIQTWEEKKLAPYIFENYSCLVTPEQCP